MVKSKLSYSYKYSGKLFWNFLKNHLDLGGKNFNLLEYQGTHYALRFIETSLNLTIIQLYITLTNS